MKFQEAHVREGKMTEETDADTVCENKWAVTVGECCSVILEKTE